MTETLQKTPLYEEHLALQARMVSFAGWEMPVQYSGIIDEHRAVRSSAGIFDVSHMSQFRVFGFGAFQFLQSVMTNDVGKIAELGSALYTLMCDEDAGIIDDVIVYHTGDLEYLVIGNAANRSTDLDWLLSHCPQGAATVDTEEGVGCPADGTVEIVDESDRTALIALQGPQAMRVLAELTPNGYEPPERFHIAEAMLDTVPVLLARTGYTGEDGVEIVCHVSHAALVWRMLLSFGEVTPCGLGSRDTLRLEMGYHLYGNDMDRGVDPISAGLGWVIGKDKGAFLGSDAIERIRKTGTERRLVGLRVDGGVPRPGFDVLHGGEQVGKVASGTYSPTLETGIATAYVPSAMAAPGTEFEVVVRKRTVSAVVTKPPFVNGTSL